MNTKSTNSQIVKAGAESESQVPGQVDGQLDLEPKSDSTFKWINGVCSFSDDDSMRSVRIYDKILFHYVKADQESEKLAVVYLFREGWAQQQELAEAFGYGSSTIRTWRQRIERDGIAGLSRKKRRSPSLKLGGTKDIAVSNLFHEGLSNCAIGRRLGVGEHAVRLALKRLGLKRERKKKDAELFSSLEESTQGNPSFGSSCPTQVDDASRDVGHLSSLGVSLEAEEISLEEDCIEAEKSQEPSREAVPIAVLENEDRIQSKTQLQLPALHKAPVSSDRTSENREGDRWLAAIGLLNDAAPIFRQKIRCWGVGVLLTIPLILENNVLEIFQKVYGRISGFFGLRNSVMSLLLMGFLRIKRLEQLKEKSPSNLGALLGLDRFPETKTLRRKIKTMASEGKALELMRVLADCRLKKEERKNLLGFLYVDGHVKEYHGSAKLGKTYIARRNCINKGSSDIWVHDAGGDPLFVVPCELNQSLTVMLEKVLDEIKLLLGDRRPTIIFDRGGWKKALFQRLIDDGWDIITYRKGGKEKFPQEYFHPKSSVVDGKEVSYEFHEMSVCISEVKLENQAPKRYWMRQVTRLKGERQIAVLTTRQDLDAVEILYRMFNRWRQENFFKYAREEYLLDALWMYDWETVPEEFDRPNPEWVKRNRTLQKARDKLGKLLVTERKLQENRQENISKLVECKDSSNSKALRSLQAKIRRFERRLQDTTSKIQTMDPLLEKLQMDRDQVEKRIPATDLECLNREMGLLSNSIKILVYHIETELLDLVAKYYPRIFKDGRKLIVAALHSEGTIEIESKILRITIDKQSSPHRTKAIQALCDELNKKKCCFPGTQIEMEYNVGP